MSVERRLDRRQQPVGAHRLVQQRQARVGDAPQVGGAGVAGDDDRRHRLADARAHLFDGVQAVAVLAQPVVTQDQVGVAQVLAQ